MAQAFVTTYQKYHRWHKIDKRTSLRPVDKLAETLPEGDIWIIPRKIGEDDGEGGHTLASAEAAVHKMYKKRLWSTYRVDYCPDMIAKEEAKPTTSSGNAILLYGENLYGPKTQKIPPPLPSARRIYGYIRPTRMYFPITTFQNVYGRVGHEILLANSDSKRTNSRKDQSNQLMEETGENETTANVPQKELEKSKAASNEKTPTSGKATALPENNKIKQFSPRKCCVCK